MVEPYIIVDKRSCPEVWVVLDCIECDWILEDCSIQLVGSAKGKAVQVDGEGRGDDSHVQEGFGR